MSASGGFASGRSGSGSYRLPMFPLGSPLLPGRLLPLRIFEPRYVALLRACLHTDDPEFGVVMIERGFEVGGGDQRTSIGTVVGILEALPRPTGDFAVVTLGRRRIRVVEWLPDDPHPWAIVEDWPDDDDDVSPDDVEYRRLVTDIGDRLRAMCRLGGFTPRDEDLLERVLESVPTAPPEQMSFALASVARFGPADQFDILRTAGIMGRLERVLVLLDDLEAVIRFQLSAGPED